MDAELLEAAIAALDPDALSIDALQAAQAIAQRLAERDDVGRLAATIARTLVGCADGVVQPHHAQWRMASAALTLRQEMARAGGPSKVALDGAIYDLEILFPKAEDLLQITVGPRSRT